MPNRSLNERNKDRFLIFIDKEIARGKKSLFFPIYVSLKPLNKCKLKMCPQIFASLETANAIYREYDTHFVYESSRVCNTWTRLSIIMLEFCGRRIVSKISGATHVSWHAQMFRRAFYAFVTYICMCDIHLRNI